jgi:hypothetical protein
MRRGVRRSFLVVRLPLLLEPLPAFFMQRPLLVG